jgi:hypothetical protein
MGRRDVQIEDPNEVLRGGLESSVAGENTSSRSTATNTSR